MAEVSVEHLEQRLALTEFEGKHEDVPENILSKIGSSDNPSHAIFTTANLLTFTRLVLTLVFLWVFCAEGSRLAGTIIYAIAASSDFLDGMIARATNTVSWFGKVLDPIVDRMLLFSGVLGLLIRRELPVWVALLVVGRDIYLAIGMRIVHRYRSQPIDVVFIGKATTALLMFGFAILLLGIPVVNGLGLVNVSWLPLLNSEPVPIGMLFVYMGCICSVITAIIYSKIGLSYIREAINSSLQNS